MNIKKVNLNFDMSKIAYGNNPSAIVLHNADASSCSVQDIHSWHRNQGWAGIGYHYFIRKNGEVYKGREDNWVGSHCLGHNQDTIGICFEGKYNEETMPQTQINAGIELVSYLKSNYGISKVYKHKDLNSTDCPGNNFPFNSIVNGKIKEKVDDELMNVKEVFCESWYLQTYKDVAAAVKKGELTAKQHYEQYGKKEGRKPNVGVPEDWNEGYYLINNPDVNRNVSSGSGYVSGLHHYLLNGWKEKRKWSIPNIESKPAEIKEGKKYYRVVTNSYSVKENADKEVAELKEKGIESFIAIYEK